MRVLVAALLAFGSLFSGAPVATAATCSAWRSTASPPPTVRVLKNDGRIVRVNFRTYVTTVAAKEWPGYLPYAVQQAGAVVVKQYGWFKAMRPRSSKAGCFDVHSGTSDQIYNPAKARVTADHHAAVRSTWGVSLFRDGVMFMTGYRRGSPGPCGYDRNGYKLYARSATRCANAGYSYKRILLLYYRGARIR